MMRADIDAVPYSGDRQIFDTAESMAVSLHKAALVCRYAQQRGDTPLEVIKSHGGRMTNHPRTWRQAICVVRDYFMKQTNERVSS